MKKTRIFELKFRQKNIIRKPRFSKYRIYLIDKTGVLAKNDSPEYQYATLVKYYIQGFP